MASSLKIGITGKPTLEMRMPTFGDEYIGRIDAISNLTSLAANVTKEVFVRDSEIEHLSIEQRKILNGMIRRLAEGLEAAANGNDTEGLNISTDDTEVGHLMSRAFWRMINTVRRPPVDSLLSRSVLSLIVTEFEYLVAQVSRLVLIERPSLLGSDQSLTLEQLESLGSVEEARAYLINKRVDLLLREAPQEWANWFAKVDVKWKDMTDNWPSFLEVFARRNAYTHAGGTASDQYRRALRQAGVEEASIPEEGSPLELGEEYLHSATELLLSFGVLLTSGTWLQLTPKTAETRAAESWIASRVASLVDLHHFSAARSITKTVLGKSRGRLKMDTEISLKTSSWIAGAQLSGASSVRGEVTAWDVSGLDLNHAHVRSVLLEDWDLAVRQVNELDGRGQMSVQKLLFEPLYAGLVAARRTDINLLHNMSDSSVRVHTTGSAVYHLVECGRVGNGESAPEEQWISQGLRPARCCHQ
jgi:hypothetical protein